MAKKDKKKIFILDFVKNVKGLSREDELQDSYGWIQKDKVVKSKKQYTRKLKNKFDYESF